MSNRLLRRALRWTTLPLSAAFGAVACVPMEREDPATPGPGWSTADFARPSLQELLARWMLPSANVWARYQKTTLLASLDAIGPAIPLPDVDAISEVADAEEAASALATRGFPRDAMIVLDLRGAASVAFATRLSNESRQPIAPVMTFNDWPAVDEMIPAEETLAALAKRTPTRAAGLWDGPTATTPVFMLDAWRLAFAYAGVDDRTTDNRYMLTPSDLPSPKALQGAGVQRVIYVVPNLRLARHEADDLNETFLAYDRAGIVLHIVDLAWLRALGPVTDWGVALGPREYLPKVRTTIVTDPSFYATTQGGFGGVYAVPASGGSGYVGTVG